MKKIINDPKNLVEEMCEGMELAYPHLIALNKKYHIIKRRQMDPEKVALISGGGSGHEPFQGGFVGKGMLDLAVCGNIFAAPSTTQVYNAIREARTKKGVLLLIVNYTGDRLCFDNAAEMAIEDDRIPVEKVYVNDDVAVAAPAARRGIAGAVLIDKIAGAAAEEGASLAEVKRIAEKAIGNLRSVGIALSSCVLPEKGTPIFHITDDEIEFGMGVHGEPGVKRIRALTANEAANMMLEHLIPDLPYARRDEVVMLVNGLGATPLQELLVLNRSVRNALMKHDLRVHATLVGNYMTSLDMAGVSLSLLKVDDELKRLFEAPAVTPAFRQ